MYKIEVKVEGTGRGLLMHKFSAATSAALESAVKKTNQPKGDPKTEAEEAAYRLQPEGDKLGQLCLPAEHFLGALTNAGASLKVQGQGKKTYKAAFSGQLDVWPAYVGLTDNSGNPLYGYQIDSRPVKIKATQGRVIRHRPHIMEWRASFEIEVRDDAIPLNVVQSALEEAGKSKCVGDYRPRFGQFRIVTFDRAQQ